MATRATVTDPPGSARSVLLTVLGDVVLPTGGTAWLGALGDVCGDLGVSAAATRQALRRLVAQDIVAARRHGRRSSYALTAPGRRRLEEAAERIYLRRPLEWDGRWRLLSYQFPTGERSARDALRRELRWLGYGTLSNGLWVCPWDLGVRLDAVLAKHGVSGAVRSFTAELDGDDRDIAMRAYELDQLRAEHRAFLDELDDEVDDRGGVGAHDRGGIGAHDRGGIGADDLGGIGADDADAAALAARLRLVHRWRRFLFLDPGLPRELVPDDWLGDRAGQAFLERYGSLEPAGWRHWLRLCAEHDPDGTAPNAPPSNLERTRALARSSATAAHRGGAGGGLSVGAATSMNGEADDRRREEEFLARIQAGGKVEATDWMPETYRTLNLKFIEMHANSEIMGALPEREWIARAPTLRRKRSLAAKVQDEVGHAHLIYRVAETLGKPRRAMYEDLISGRGKFHNVFHYPTYTWGDVACIGFLVDGAAIVTQRALLGTSYAPYVRVMRRVVAEESLHYRHGEDIMLALASGTDEQVEMLQEAVDRWWEPTMHFFGTNVSAEDDPMIHWGVKTQTNETSRQEWFSTYVPKLWDMGIETPDPKLRWDADAKRWDYTEPDWDRLAAIVKGEPTPATATRLFWRQALHRNHAWIQDIIVGDRVPAAA